MTKVYLFLSFIALLASCQVSHAQVSAPQLLCVKSDTLFWNPPESTCGTFVSTNIFTSTDRDGIYSLLTTITDPTLTSYEDRTPGRNFYYLTATYDCSPNETSGSSDTLDNRNPSPTRIESVSVEGDGVRIIWVENPDPETVGYIIYRSTNQGTTPIDTVIGALEYLDRKADPNARSETYNVVALDACGNQGDFDISHTTIHLNVESNFCDQSLQMTWSNYEGWQNGRENNQVWLGVNGGDINFEHQVGPEDTLAYLLGILDETEYCLQIVSKENGSDVVSRSNVVCLTSDVLNPLDFLEINNVSVTASGQIEVTWTYDSEADIDSITVFRSTDSLNFEALPANLLESPASTTNLFIDSDVDVESNRYFYQIQAIDACETLFQSNKMSSVLMHLTTREGGQNVVDWSPIYTPGRLISAQGRQGSLASEGQASLP